MERKISLFNPARLFADSFRNTFFDDWGLSASLEDMEMFEQGSDKLVVRMKVSGFKEEDIDISIENDTLTVIGNVKAENEEEDKNKKYYFKELQQESFTKSIRLPVRIQADKAVAEVESGVLRVTMPKSDEAKAKKISVKAVGK